MGRLQNEYGKLTTNDDQILFRKGDKLFILKGDVLKVNTDNKFNATDSPDARLIMDFVDQMCFDTCSRGKSV